MQLQKNNILICILNFCLFVFIIQINSGLIISQEPENISELRFNWFMGQRGFPNGNIVSDSAYSNAVQEKNNLYPPNDYFYTNELWTFIGPQPLISGVAWPEQVAGKVSIVAFDRLVTNGTKYYVGGADGGLFVTTNSGSSWTDLTRDLPTLSSGAFTILIINNQQIFLYGTGVGDYCFLYNYRGLGLFRSTNGGANWTHITSGIPSVSTQFSKIVTLTGNENIVFAATNTGLYRSTDAGITWALPTGIDSKICTDVACTRDESNNIDYVIAVGYSGVNGGIGYSRSTDGGLSFSNYNPSGFAQSERTEVTVSSDLPNVIYGTTVYSGAAILFMSTDYGSNYGTYGTLSSHGCQSNQNLILSVDPTNYLILFYGNVEFKKATNGGINFDWQDAPRGHDDQHAICFNPSNTSQMLLGNDGGLYYSSNQFTTLTQKNDNICYTQVFRVSSNHFASNRIACGIEDEGIAFKDDNLQWTYKPGAENYDGTNIYFSPASESGNKCVGSLGPLGNLLYLTNYGEIEYFGASAGIYGYIDGLGNDWIKPFAGHKYQAGIFYTARRDNIDHRIVNIFKSIDNGASYLPHGQILFNQNPNQLAPTNLEFAPSNASIAYITLGNIVGTDQNRLLKSEDGGVSWSPCNMSSIPNRYFTRIAIDRDYANIIYLTLSGFSGNSSNEMGHVFKSTNGGSNWFCLDNGIPSGSTALPNIAVNDIVVRYDLNDRKELIVATDAGVFRCADSEGPFYSLYKWKVLADGLPNSVALDLDHNTWEGKLRVATFGRGVWETDLPGSIYVKSDEFLTSYGEGLDVIDNIIILSGGTLSIPSACTIKMPAGKKIIIEDGGKLDVTSTDPVYFTSQSGTWGGIEIKDGGYANLKNCVFSNTETPVTITSSTSGGNDIDIEYCTFNEGSIVSTGRDNVYIQNCSFNSPSSTTGVAISVVYGDNIVVNKNTIRNSNVGISISNSDPAILENTIEHDQQVTVNMGISADNSYGAIIKYNKITDYPVGIYLNSSSPVMYCNTFTGVSQTSTALFAEYNSSPRLRPYDDGGEVIWDAGKDTLDAVNNYSNNNAVYIHSNSIPDLDGGCNVINSSGYSINGDIENCFMSYYDFYARNNTWNSFSENVCDAGYYIDPTGCGQGQGGGERGDEKIKDPPPPIIINYGHGIYDTIKITLRNFPVSNDNLLYSQAMENELQGNFQQAITKYQQLITSYQDSITASNSLKRIIHCYEKMNANSLQFSGLRSFYQGLVQANPTDTGFVNIAEELAAKCLVKMRTLPEAITEYEGIVQSSNDSLKILCAELNIIETYMIMNQGGMAKSFTGKIQALKPISVLDGIKMINEKLHRINRVKKDNLIPKEFSLSQNYPNPFNPITKINYALPQKSNVTIKVFDILGRLVKTVVNEFKDAGYYTVTFDGTGLASGVYFYTIEAGNFKDSKKMVLIK